MRDGLLAVCRWRSRRCRAGHFAVLKAAGLVATERRGTTIGYSLQLSALKDGLLGLVWLLPPRAGRRASS